MFVEAFSVRRSKARLGAISGPPPHRANTGRVGDPGPPPHRANTGRVGDPGAVAMEQFP
jgi:hypothetical protein